MKNQEVITKFFTALAAVVDYTPISTLEEELQTVCTDLFTDATIATLQKDAIVNNLIVVDKTGKPILTKKGYDYLNQQKVVEVSPDIFRMPHDKLIKVYLKLAKQICYRIENFPAFLPLIQEENIRNKVYDSVNCVVDSVIKVNTEETV